MIRSAAFAALLFKEAYMKIVVLTGSPNKNGASFLMADKFAEGAMSVGHEVIRFDTAFMDIGFCRACDFCKTSGGKCAIEDEFAALRAAVENCDLLAVVSPVYYFTFPAQFKRALDRFHAFGRSLRGKEGRGLLITVCADERPSATDLIKTYFGKIMDYFHWRTEEGLSALGVATRDALLTTDYPTAAYDLGASLK